MSGRDFFFGGIGSAHPLLQKPPGARLSAGPTMRRFTSPVNGWKNSDLAGTPKAASSQKKGRAFPPWSGPPDIVETGTMTSGSLGTVDL